MTTEATTVIEIHSNKWKNDGLIPGDVLCVREADSLFDGKVVVGKYNGKVFFKRCHLSGELIRLETMREGTADPFSLPIEDVKILYIVESRIRPV